MEEEATNRPQFVSATSTCLGLEAHVARADSTELADWPQSDNYKCLPFFSFPWETITLPLTQAALFVILMKLP